MELFGRRNSAAMAMNSRKWFALVALMVAAFCVAVTSGHMNCTAYNATKVICTKINGTGPGHEGGRWEGGPPRGGRPGISGLQELAENEKRSRRRSTTTTERATN